MKPKRPQTSRARATPFEMGRLVEPRADRHLEASLPSEVFDHVEPDGRHMARCAREADRIVSAHAPTWENLPLQIEPDPLPRPAPAPIEWPEADRLKLEAHARLQRLRAVLDRLLSGRRVNLSEPLAIVDELIALGAAHPNRFAQLALVTHGASDRLAAHGHATCTIAIGIALRLGWSPEHIRLAGLAGLLADCGMALVPEEIRRGARSLSDVERNRVRRAPGFSVALLERLEGMPEEALLAIYQHHEREDGSGYPEGLHAERISDLARVVAVSDTFAAACARREYRMTKRPFDAVRELIDQAAAGELSRPVVRALLELTGLFPVGSYVTLSNDQPAIVIAANPSRIDRPRVLVLSPRAGRGVGGLTVDLAALDPGDLRVARAIDAPAARLPAPAGSEDHADAPGL